MKTLYFYFGAKQQNVFGGISCDVLEVPIKESATEERIQEYLNDIKTEKWVYLPSEGGSIYVNTNNILWFEIRENKEKNND